MIASKMKEAGQNMEADANKTTLGMTLGQLGDKLNIGAENIGVAIREFNEARTDGAKITSASVGFMPDGEMSIALMFNKCVAGMTPTGCQLYKAKKLCREYSVTFKGIVAGAWVPVEEE